MGMNHKDIEKLIQQVRSVLATLETALEPEIEVPPEIAKIVEQKMADRICLAWEHKIPDGEEVP